MKRVCAKMIKSGFVLLLCLTLSACRSSPVLQEVVYQQTAPITDTEQQQMDPADAGEQTEDFENAKDESAETERDAQTDLGLMDGTGEADHAAETDYTPGAGNDWPADSLQNQGAGVGSVNGGDSGQEAPGYEPGGDGTSKTLVDASGRTVDLPEQVQTVTAVNAAAQMVEMLGGEGRLLGTDRAFLESPLAVQAFPDLAQVNGWWEGDGKQILSPENFAALLDARPDVCLEVSGQNTFSDSQVAELKRAGITYFVLPELSSLENLKQMTSLLGEMLGTNTRTGESAASIAKAYSTWVDSLLKDVEKMTGGTDLVSLYISDWDDSAAYQLKNTKGSLPASGTGLAVAYSPKKAQLLSTFLSAAHITNESTRIRSAHRQTDGVYVAPMFHQFDPVVTGSKATFYSGAGEYGAAFDLFVAHMVNDSVYYQLGCDVFPAVIVADSGVRDSLAENWFWQYHETNESGYITVGGQSFYCGIVGEYQIYVNPQGMCDWAEGCAESPLEACWAACKLADACAMEKVRTYIREFYQQFFRLSLSDMQLQTILGE